MTIRLLAVARAELDEAVIWYEAQARGLGEVSWQKLSKPFALSNAIRRHGIH
ncbi:MAG TPA: hypothetical protein VII49_05745 [Rhizomicrobium sp.]